MHWPVRAGRFQTRADHAHAVHVVVDGLRPARDYWYRFRSGSWISPIGRTRTAPTPGQRVRRLTWATASCQAWTDGHFTAHRHLAADDLDLVVFLGDYIYERPIDRSVRPLMLADDLRAETDTLLRYRQRYGLYKSDPDLQAAHQAAPWIVTWDDHEVADGYTGRHDFARRRHEAYHAFWENQPLRGGPPRQGSLRMHRRATYGELVTFHVLDTRQYRSPTAPGDSWRASTAMRTDRTRTMLGATQEAWLSEGLATSTTRWNVVAQQVLAGRLDLHPGDDELFNADAWDGYAVAQQRLHDDLARTANPVVLTGDVHAAYALDIERHRDRRPRSLAVELATTSISSGGDGAPSLETGEAFLAANAHLRHVDQRRGYLRCDLDAERLLADFRSLPFVERPGATAITGRSFAVEAGRSRVQ